MFVLQKRSWQRYVPEFMGIRERFDAARKAAKDPIAKAAVLGDIEVEIHGLTAGEARLLQDKVLTRVRRDRVIESPNAASVDKELFIANVRILVPFQVGDQAKPDSLVAVETPDVLWELGAPELVREIRTAIETQSALEDGSRD